MLSIMQASQIIDLFGILSLSLCHSLGPNENICITKLDISNKDWKSQHLLTFGCGFFCYTLFAKWDLFCEVQMKVGSGKMQSDLCTKKQSPEVSIETTDEEGHKWNLRQDGTQSEKLQNHCLWEKVADESHCLFFNLTIFLLVSSFLF